MTHTRPRFSQPPLRDLLPPSYISSVKRAGTGAGVRFSTEEDQVRHLTPSLPDDTKIQKAFDLPSRSSTRVNQSSEKPLAELDESNASDSDAVLAKILRGHEKSSSNSNQDFTSHQIHQLNTAPQASFEESEKAALEATSPSDTPSLRGVTPTTPVKPVLANPFPGNLPLSLLRALEACVHRRIRQGHSSSDSDAKEPQGWTIPQGERGLTLVRSLSKLLAEVEHIGDGEIKRLRRTIKTLLSVLSFFRQTLHRSRFRFISLSSCSSTFSLFLLR